MNRAADWDMKSARQTPLLAAGPWLLAFVLLLPAAAVAQPGGMLPGPLPLFPADNWWNADVSAAPWITCVMRRC